MKLKSTLITLSICLALALSGQAQGTLKRDSIQIFADSLFDVLKTQYLHRNSIDNWEELKSRFQEEAANYPTLVEGLQETRSVFDSIGCSHCSIFVGDAYYPASQKPLLFEDYSTQFVEKYQSGVEFSVLKLADQYGYIVIPGMLFLDLPQDSINLKTQKMYDQIVELDQNNELKGWIIDLRFNIGGDAYLMLNALYHLLGNKVVYTELDLNKSIAHVNQLVEGKFYSGDSVKNEIRIIDKADLNTPVALIIGNWTASAGECVLLGFAGRENVLRIGEPTYGFTTGNEMFDLPFGIKSPITTCYLADMYGNYSENIEPEIKLNRQDNFEQLLKDPNIMKAIEFIDSKK